MVRRSYARRRTSSSRRPRRVTRFARKTRVGSKRRSSGPKTLVYRGTCMPERLMTTLKYGDSYSIGSVAYSQRTYSVNSLYDPDVSGTGSQPYGFDQLCSATSFYNRYKVNRAYLCIRAINLGTAPAYIDVLPYYANTFPSTGTGTHDFMKEIPGNRTMLCTSNASSSTCKMVCKAIPGYIFGLSKVHTATSEVLTAQYNQSPAAQAYFLINTEACDGSSNITIKLDYIVFYKTEFYATVHLPAS